ncbi:MAG: hypothetical protein DRJ38_04360 [Thermoprotei archaeon]|nr:MAG: hypothetical protein DRJ38_04360 [Thermoprotei archaeon]
MAEKEPEIYEYGSGFEALSVLREAIKNLYGGISALKISVEMLNDRIGELENAMDKLEELAEKNAEIIDKEREAMEELTNKIKSEAELFLKNFSKESHLILDSFVLNFKKEVENAVNIQKQLIEDISSFRAEVKNVLGAMLDTVNVLKGDMAMLISKFDETRILLAETSSRISALEENTSARLKELELLVTDLSLKISNIEKRISQLEEES